MKNLQKWIGIAAFVAALLLDGCASGAKQADRPGLDQAIKEAAARLDGQITEGTKIAILNFTSPSDQFSAYVIDELTANLLETKKLTVVDRKEIDLIRGELNFQFSGEVSDDSMQELGKMLGAEAIVSGSLMEIGGAYRITIRALMVQTAVVAVQYRTDINDDSRAQALLGSGSPQPAQQASSPAAKTAQETPAARPSSSQAYEVGETGPAGGIVFYDKGFYSDGWRYLEYAPSNFRNVYWGPYGLVIAGTGTEVGAGKKNTELIVKVLDRRRDKGLAAQVCRDFTLNGYKDWFLPSKDELNLLYAYLEKNAMLGSRFGFYTWYYSSSYCNDAQAWGHNFMNGYQGGYDISFAAGGDVRAIRSF